MLPLNLIATRVAHWPDFQDLKPLPDVPVAILMAARYEPRAHDGLERDCEPRECHRGVMEVTRDWYARQLSEVTHGMLTVVTDSGHFIQNDDPELVVWTIHRTWSGEPARPDLRLAPDLLEEYVGTYRTADGRELAVIVEYGQLFVQLTGQSALPILAEAPDDFVAPVVDADVRFERGENGAVKALEIAQNGRESRWERVP